MFPRQLLGAQQLPSSCWDSQQRLGNSETLYLVKLWLSDGNFLLNITSASKSQFWCQILLRVSQNKSGELIFQVLKMLTSSDFNVRGKLSLRGNSNNLGGNNSKVENRFYSSCWDSLKCLSVPETLMRIFSNIIINRFSIASSI